MVVDEDALEVRVGWGRTTPLPPPDPPVVVVFAVIQPPLRRPVVLCVATPAAAAAAPAGVACVRRSRGANNSASLALDCE